MKGLSYHIPKQLEQASKLRVNQKKTAEKSRQAEQPKTKARQSVPFFYTYPIFKTKKYELW
jgi:hypothetical protein